MIAEFEMADRAESVAERAGEAATKVRGRAADGIERVEEKVRSGAAAGEVASEFRGTAGDIKDAAVEQGRHLYAAAREQATSFADQRKNEAAQSVSDIAASLRETGRQFGERPNIQSFVGSAADGLEQFADGLRDRSFADLYTEVEDYARRSPVAVGAVALVAGFMLARFIKSSSDNLVDDQPGPSNKVDERVPPRRPKPPAET